MNTGIKTIDNMSSKYTDRINDVSDERKSSSDGKIWIYLKRGWCHEGSHGEHSVRERTVTRASRALRNTTKCKCNDCVNETGYWD